MNKTVIVYDDYNQTISVSCNDRFGGVMMGTITRNIGIEAERNGYKLIEIVRYEQSYELQTRDMTNTITSVYKDNIVMEEQMMQEPIEARPKGKGWKWIPEEKCWIRLRRLTPRECFRLMDVYEEDIDKIQNSGVSTSQQYKLAGNSIVVACMSQIFTNLFRKDKPAKTTLF